jgi:hypothetical protein
MFEARHQRHMAHHGAVDANVLGLSGLPHPCGNEHMRGRNIGQSGLQTGRVEQVSGDCPQTGHTLQRTARQTINSPASVNQLGRPFIQQGA